MENGVNEGVNQTVNTDAAQEQAQQPALETNNTQTNSEMILGKFKSIDELTAAYKNMESQQGQQSKELGELRKKAEIYDSFQKQLAQKDEHLKAAKDYFSKVVPKYQKDEYFKNPEFTNLYQEAFNALGTNLDTDKFVSLLDNYVKSRVTLHEKAKSAKKETENIKSQMQFSDSPAKTSSKSIPKLDNLSKEEIEEYVAKHI